MILRGWWSCSVNPVANPFFNGDDDDDDDVFAKTQTTLDQSFRPLLACDVYFVKAFSVVSVLSSFATKKSPRRGARGARRKKALDDTEVCAQSMHKCAHTM